MTENQLGRQPVATDPVERLSAASCAGLLQQNTKVHFISALITVTAIVTMLVFNILDTLDPSVLLLLLLLVLLGVAETVMSVRTGFDAVLLRDLADTQAEYAAGLSTLDQALRRLQLMPENKTGRDLDTRLQACLRLFRLQLLLCAAQIVVITGYAIIV